MLNGSLRLAILSNITNVLRPKLHHNPPDIFLSLPGHLRSQNHEMDPSCTLMHCIPHDNTVCNNL